MDRVADPGGVDTDPGRTLDKNNRTPESTVNKSRIWVQLSTNIPAGVSWTGLRTRCGGVDTDPGPTLEKKQQDPDPTVLKYSGGCVMNIEQGCGSG